MFVDEKAAGEKQPVKVGTLKPSEAIRRGHKMIDEYKGNFLYAGRGCALGAMWIGYGRTEDEFLRFYKRANNGPAVFAAELGIPLTLAERISIEHTNGKPRLAIAASLEEIGL